MTKPKTPEEIASQVVDRYKRMVFPSGKEALLYLEKEIGKVIHQDRQLDPCPVVFAVVEATKDMCEHCKRLVRLAVENS